MKFLWFEIETKKELRNANAELVEANKVLSSTLEEEGIKYDKLAATHSALVAQFPLELGQTVYDVALRSAEGKYTKKNASREHSCVTPVVVDKKNYFGLVDRINRNDVFLDKESADKYLDSICK